MTSVLSNLLVKRKPVLLALGGIIIVTCYISGTQSSDGSLPSLHIRWPSATGNPEASPQLPMSLQQEHDVEALPPPSLGDWSTFSQISSIRHLGWNRPENLPQASDGALSGKGHRASFRTNLRDDMRYLTTWPAFGFTNQFICIYIQIYMAHLTGRVPILQPFLPHYAHLRGHGAFLPIGEVYDLNRLRAVLDLPIVEMWELKASKIPNTSDPTIEEEPVEEEIGCWSMWMSAYGGGYGTNSDYKFNCHWTPIPKETVSAGILKPSLLDVVDLIQPRAPGAKFFLPPGSQTVLTQLNITQPEIVPDDHVACIDITMFMLVEPHRWDVTGEWVSGDGAWQAVGRHMRFQPHLLDLAEQYLRRALKVTAGVPTPPYVGVHIRRTDFSDQWKALTLRDYAHATAGVLENIRTYLGVPVEHILVLTDETDPEWLAQVNAYSGMTVMDHNAEQTMEKHGPWYATLLDNVLMSGGIGLVGLHQSSMAIMASHRVTEWNAGVSKLIFEDYSNEVPADWAWPG